MKISLVRHGRTVWGAEKRTAGLVDIPIDEAYRSEIHAFARGLRMEGFDLILSSPMRRAVQTAEVLSQETGLKVELDSRLAEFSYGDWEGLTIDEIQARYPEALQQYFQTPEALSVPGGGTLADHSQRVGGFLQDLLKRPYSAVLLVGHAMTLKLLLLTMQGRGLADLWQTAEFRNLELVSCEMPSGSGSL